MSRHQSPASHHDAHAGHAHHGAVVHEPPPDVQAAYHRAFGAAQPDPGRSVITLDLDARPVDWTFSPGLTLPAWGYNGQVPGPVIEGEVGDVLEVRFKNSLAEPTTIHWHGLRVPAPMDGTENVQWPVAPGQTFVYRFRLPDAGTFWYHPHSNETVQLERGLYGALIVRGPGEPALDHERVLVLDDLRLDKKNQLATFGGFVERHDGREGDVRLVNGKVEPELTLAAGTIERWRVVNASSARYIRLSIGGAPFHILGTDGGLIDPGPLSVTEVLLAPADRVDLAVGPFEQGTELAVESLEYLRRTIRKRKTERFATLRVGPAKPSRGVIPVRLRSITPLAPATATPSRTVTLGVRVSLKRIFDFVINKERHHQDQPVKVGELQVWDVKNGTLMDHPFHLHGFFFQVLSINGEPPPFRSWEDVINIPPRGTVRIAWMPDNRPGSWMYHCHILEHHASGMMAHFDVVP
jgi:FtsP/CotA-like multicopper oxidase with cupredoxin domain